MPNLPDKAKGGTMTDNLDYDQGYMKGKLEAIEADVGSIKEDVRSIKNSISSLDNFKAKVYGAASAISLFFSFAIHKLLSLLGG